MKTIILALALIGGSTLLSSCCGSTGCAATTNDCCGSSGYGNWY